MKKIAQQLPTLFIAVIMGIAISLAVTSQDGEHLLTQWLAFGLLSNLMLWYLRKPVVFFSLINDKAFISYLLFILWALCSSLFWSVSKAPSILTIGVLLGGLFSYFIGYATSNKNVFNFYYLLLIIGLVLAFLTFYQAFILDINRPSGTLANYNTHATFLGMILMPWLIRFALRPSSNRFQTITLSLIAILFALAMALTLSRGTILFLLVCFFCFAVFAWRQQCFFKQSLYFFSAIITGYIFSALLLPNDSVLTRITSVTKANSIEAIGSGRHLLWNPAWQVYLDHPFLGAGLNSFRFLHTQYKDPLSAELGYFVHNDFFQFLIELGPVGFILFIVLTGIILKRLLLLLQNNTESLSNKQIEAFALLTTSAAMLVHTFFTFHLYHLTMQIIWGFYLGRAAQLLSVTHHLPQTTVSAKLHKQFLGFYQAFRIIFIVAILLFGFSFYFLDKAKQTEDPQEKLDYYWKAGLLFPALDFYQSLSAQQFLKHLSDPSLALSLRETLARIAQQDVDIAISKAQVRPINYVTKANIVKAMNGDITVISKLYQKALRLNPYLLNVRGEYTQYLVEQGETNKALMLFWDAWDRLYITYYQNGIIFLNAHLTINQQYGNPEDNIYIQQEIERLTTLKKKNKGGEYIFHRESKESKIGQ